MTDEIYTDPLGRKYHVFTGSEYKKLFGKLRGVLGDRYQDDEKIFIPYHEPDDKIDFPAATSFNDLYWSVGSGTVIHSVDRDRAYGPHQPRTINETEDGYRAEGALGFSATSLSVFSEIDWHGECFGVMEAHGWNSPSGGLARHIVDYVSRECGACSITKAKLKFGENWEARIAEIAAERLVQPLSRIWYAVNMMALYYCHYDDLRLGYLWAEYQMRMGVEKNALRGEGVVKSARSGGLARRAATSMRSENVVSAMRTRIEGGQSIANAARLTFREGLGTSPEANRKLWKRHRQK